MAERSPLLREKLGFFGVVAASLSHELKNVLATINELSGLIEDQSMAAEAGRPLRPERLKKACVNINKQVLRGSTLVERLNFFAHSVDKQVADVELGGLLTKICDICDRFAMLRQVTLARKFTTQKLPLTLDPFALQHAVYLAVRVALNVAEAGQAVSLKLEPLAASGRGCRLAIESENSLGEEGRSLVEGSLMRQLVSELGAEISLVSAQGEDSVVFTWAG